MHLVKYVHCASETEVRHALQCRLKSNQRALRLLHPLSQAQCSNGLLAVKHAFGEFYSRHQILFRLICVYFQNVITNLFWSSLLKIGPPLNSPEMKLPQIEGGKKHTNPNKWCVLGTLF